MGGGSSFWKENKFIRCVTLLTDVSSALSLRVSLPNNKKRNLLHTGRLLERDESTMGRLLEGGQACLFDKGLKFPYQSAAAVDMSLLRHLLNSVAATAAPVGKEFLKSFVQ